MKNFNFINMVMVSLLLSCCIKPPHNNGNNNNNNNTGTETPQQTSILQSFKFETSKNKSIAEDIVMEILPNNNVSGYLKDKADLSSLIATFDVGNGKMYVNDIEQTSGKTVNDFTSPVSYKLITADNKTIEYIVSLVPYTGLPVVVITTENQKDITDRKTWIKAHIKIDGMGNYDNTDAECAVKGRGNGSWKFPKKPFNLKLTERGHILGMKKHKRWSFLANYMDRTLIRNAATFKMGYEADALEWTPHGEFAELILNGNYIGNFQICEQVRVDKNRGAIDEMTAADIQGENLSGGYLLEFDTYYDEVNKFMTPIEDWPVNIKNPDEDILTPEQFVYIRDYIVTVEELMHDGDFEELYDKYIDIDSFVDYWLVQSLTGNTEIRPPHSVFCYKKRNGKLYAGPIWDFDLSTFTKSFTSAHAKSIWYKYLLQDDVFKKRVKERFEMFSSRTNAVIPEYISSQESYLTTSTEINFRLWPIDLEKLWGRVNGDEEKSSEEAFRIMQDMYTYRMEWLRNYVNSL